MDFYVGADATWLGKARYPLMVSHGRLRARKSYRRALAPWVCDSRMFSELQQYGRRTFSAESYAHHVRQYAREIGNLRWVSPRDMMCEPAVISGGTFKGVTFAGTGLSVDIHQDMTVEDFVELRSMLDQPGDPHVIPSLQGWEEWQYFRCLDKYERAGVDLRAEPVVGLGSTCRREGTKEVLRLVTELSAYGIRLHGYGAKTQGLAMYGHLLTSADSFAWSYGARRRGGLCQHGRGIRWETNCPDWAGAWRTNILEKMSH